MNKSKFFFPVFFLLMSASAAGQQPISHAKLSPRLQMLLSGDPNLVEMAKRRLELKAPPKSDKSSTSRPTNAEIIVRVLIQFKGDAKALESPGVQINAVAGDVATAEVSISALEALANNPNVMRIEDSKKRKPTLDTSVPSTGANKVWGGLTVRPLPPVWTGITGKNVVVGVVDTGIDLDHQDFKDASGKTRIVSVWDQTATGTPPTGFASGDECSQAEINARSEKTDLVTSNAFNGTFSILQGAGATFSAAVKSPEPNVPVAVAVADFDGDGNMDLVFADVNNATMSVALGHGDGTFATPTHVVVAAGFEMHAVAVGDFNNDGNMDVALALGNSFNIAVLLGKGDGTFQAPVYYTVGTNPSAIAVADLNGDGHLDLAVTNYQDSTVSILLGLGDGSFGVTHNFAVGPVPSFPSGNFPTGVAIGDFNGDGFPDLAISSWGRNGGIGIGNEFSILLGNGDGTFKAPTTIATGHFEHSIALGDFNRDGKLDVALESYSHDLTILLGNGDGTLGAPADYELHNTSGLFIGQVTLAVGDFNGDGILDAANLTRKGSYTGGYYDTITVLLGNGDGTFGPATDFPTNSQNSTGIATGNFHTHTCAERDTEGHGTHVSGIAVGNGSASNSPHSNAPYRHIGMAPEADLVFVKTNFTDNGIIEGVQYVEKKAASLGVPVVVNLSLGGQSGPHDGTSVFEKGIDNLTGAGKIIVAASGNEGQDMIHASGKLTLGGLEHVGFTVQPGVIDAVLELWYAGADQFGVSLTSPAGTCVIPASGFLFPGNSGQTFSVLTNCGNVAITTSAIIAANGDRQIFIELQASGAAITAGTWTVNLSGSGCGSLTSPCVNVGTYDIWAQGALPSGGCGSNPCVTFADHVDANSTIGAPATATSVIAVGSHATKTAWVGVGGNGVDPSVTVGNISTFSSLGPRRTCTSDSSLDCTAFVQKPELTAPGEEIMSSYAAGTDTATCFDVTPPSKCLDRDGQHHIEQGTSMAAPHVTGAVALLLAKYGALSACETKEALKATRTDAATGATPNNTWGYGKLAIDLGIASRPASMATVPNVVGLSTLSADSAINTAGLHPGTVTHQTDPTIPQGDVISETPTAGSCAVLGSNVDLIVSAGPDTTVVPNVVGLTVPAATQKITAANLVVGTMTQASSPTVPSGDVISESPAAGTVVLQQSSVNLVVSTGPAQVVVPNVVGMTQAAATTAIHNATLVVGTVTTAASTTVAKGNVISESPAAGTHVNPSSAVNLVVSSGVVVPNVVGMTQAAATTAIHNAVLAVGTVTTAASTTVPKGNVISESPAAGTHVNPNSAVNLVVSSGVVVPNVVGMTQAAATTAIHNAVLVVGTVTTAASTTVPKGNVISESPAAGTHVNPNSAVNLVVSSGMVVPNVVGMTQAAATTAIHNAVLVVGTVTTAASTTVPKGNVISESPAAGTHVNPNSAVNLVVSSGVVVPNVVGMTQAAATTAIHNAVLVVGTVTSAHSATVPKGNVISQSPAAGTRVNPNSSVNLVVSLGP